MMEDVAMLKENHAMPLTSSTNPFEATKWIREVFTMFDRAWYSTK